MAVEGQTPRFGWIALIGAGALLVAAIGYASFRDKATPAPAATPTQAADDIGTLEARANANPNDAHAWAEFGMALYQGQDFARAAVALEHAARLAPDRVRLWSALGESRANAGPDPMPSAALDAFRRALALDPKDPPARYFMAVSRDLKGDHEGAIADWLALLADTPPGASWEADLRRTIVQVGQKNHIEVSARLAAVKQPAPAMAAPMPGPDPVQLRAAAALPLGQQQEMARGMVERLEGRLKADPTNLDGWVMLMRSRMTLGEPAKASAALAAAVAANPGARAELEAQASALGVPYAVD